MQFQKPITIALGLFICLFSFLTPQLAQAQISEKDKKAIEEIVRNYILEHPEILPEAINILQSRQEAAQQAQMGEVIAKSQNALLRDGFSVVVGNPTGDVTLVEFYDYRCPYCVQAHSDIEKLIKEDKNLRVVYKQFPVKDHPDQPPVSLTAARMAQAIYKQGLPLFLTFHEKLMAQNTRFSMDDLGRIATEIGVDMTRLNTDMQDPKIIDGIRTTFELANDIGLSGTPTFIIGQQVIVGAQGYSRLKEAIDSVRANK